MSLTLNDGARIFSCDSCEAVVRLDEDTPPGTMKGWRQFPAPTTEELFHYCPECIRWGRTL